MTRKELIERLAMVHGSLAREQAEIVVKTLLAQMSESLAGGERIEIRGFGSFSLRHRPPRRARNPRTGEAVEVSERYRLHFKPGKALRARVNGESDR